MVENLFRKDQTLSFHLFVGVKRNNQRWSLHDKKNEGGFDSTVATERACRYSAAEDELDTLEVNDALD